MELAELTVRGFTEEIASASPAPGGGSAAALAGAVGAALTAMVSGLTIEQGLKACTQPPLAVMQLCAEGLELLESLLGKTNATAASDFGVACLSLRAGMQGAWLNVCINTGSLHDAAFAAGARAAGQKLLDTGLPRADRCYAAMLAVCSEG